MSGLTAPLFGGVLGALIPGRGTFYLLLAAFVAGAAASGWAAHTLHQAELTERVNNTIATERMIDKVFNADERARYVRTKKQKEKADETIRKLRATLADIGDCRVPGAAVGLLNDTQLPADAGAAAVPGPAGKKAETSRDSQCARELEICGWNYANVCVPNEQDLNDLRATWRKTRTLINKGRGP